MAEIINTSTLKREELNYSLMQGCYNGLDCAITREVSDKVLPQVESRPETALIYRFERALRGPALEMMMRGLKVDMNERQQMISRCEDRIENLRVLLNEMIRELLGWKEDARGWCLNPASPTRLKYFFYGVCGLPEHTKWENGQRKATVNREALEKFQEQADFPIDYICEILLSLRDLGKTVGTLKWEVERDGRMRFGFSPVATESGRWSSSSNIYGRAGNCLPPDAEVLTQNGWMPIGSMPSEIMVFDGENLYWENVQAWNKNYYRGNLLQFKTEQAELAMTPEHKMPFYTYRCTETRIDEAKNLFHRSVIKIPNTGYYKGGWYKPSNPRLLVATLADGHYNKQRVKFEFRKERKCQRLLNLYPEASEIASRKTKGKEARCFTVPRFHDWPVDKKWGPWVLSLDQETAWQMVDELCHWDGWMRGESTVFITSDESQANWVATLAHLVGKSATVTKSQQSRDSWSNTLMYKVNIKPRQFVHVKRQNWSRRFYDGYVYCPTVSTGLFLCRYKGKICVSHNSQQITNRLRRVFVADEGRKFAYCDLQSAESMAVAYLAGDEAYIEANEADLKVHTYVAQMVWPEYDWPSDPLEATAAASEPYYRHFSMYDLSKMNQHASNYGATPLTIAKHLKLDTHIVEEFQSRYFNAFSGIPRWHKWTAEQIQRHGVLTTPLGRRRRFFGRRGDKSTLREAIAYVPQSTVGDILNLALYRVWRDFYPTVRVMSQLHDAILIDYPEGEEDRILPLILQAMQIPVKVMGCDGVLRTMAIPADAKVGWNWHEVKEKDLASNPDGLMEWSGNDTRTRQIPANVPTDEWIL